MIITITPKTSKGITGIKEYFKKTPETTKIMKEHNITLEKKDDNTIITTNFNNPRKDKTYLIILMKDLKKEHKLTPQKDYHMEARFT